MIMNSTVVLRGIKGSEERKMLELLTLEMGACCLFLSLFLSKGYLFASP